MVRDVPSCEGDGASGPDGNVEAVEQERGIVSDPHTPMKSPRSRAYKSGARVLKFVSARAPSTKEPKRDERLSGDFEKHADDD